VLIYLALIGVPGAFLTGGRNKSQPRHLPAEQALDICWRRVRANAQVPLQN
jgi:hypothetical protein